jgi:hypothetical protein
MWTVHICGARAAKDAPSRFACFPQKNTHESMDYQEGKDGGMWTVAESDLRRARGRAPAPRATCRGRRGSWSGPPVWLRCRTTATTRDLRHTAWCQKSGTWQQRWYQSPHRLARGLIGACSVVVGVRTAASLRRICAGFRCPASGQPGVRCLIHEGNASERSLLTVTIRYQ